MLAACGRIQELPLGTTSFNPMLAAAEQALAEDRVDVALEQARLFQRRFPGEVSSGLLGTALWRTGRLNEAEGHLRRAAKQGDRRGSLGLARVAISRGRWETAREWASAADAGDATQELLFAVARATGDAGAAREAADVLADGARGDDLAEAEAMRASVDDGWSGSPGTLTLERSTDGAWLVPVRLGDRTLHMRLALDEPRSWIRADALRAGDVVAPERQQTDGGAAGLPAVVVVGPVTLAGVERRRMPLRVRPEAPPGSDGVVAADVLSDLRWSLDPTAGRLALATAAEAPDAPPGSDAEARRMLRPPGGAEVRWLAVRVLREGLDVQWLLMPRIEARVMSAAMSPERHGTIDDDAVDDLGVSAERSTTTLEARLGDWWPRVSWRVEDLSARAGGGRVAPRLLLGEALLERWRLLWDPGTRQLGLIPGPQERSEATSSGGLQ